MRTALRILSSLAVILSLVQSTSADARLPALFSDHMVLQRDMPVPVWGWADPSEQITVTLGEQKHTATADAEGRWSVRLNELQPGEPLTLMVAGRNTVTIRDVLVGEVWLCSGQSNMAMTVSRAQDFEKEQAAASFPAIRMFKVESKFADTPQSDVKGSWAVCSPETVGGFSATAYFFGRKLHQELGVPIGLINSSVGGTPIEAWISEPAQRSEPRLREQFAQRQQAVAAFNADAARERYERELARWKEEARQARAQKKQPPRAPADPVALFQRKNTIGGLFNGMIAPLVPYAIRGVIWYQGEANSTPEKAPLYAVQLPLLVRDWRRQWQDDELPFAWVQLPNFRGNGRNWPVVREAMHKTLGLLDMPFTGMAVTTDIGDPNDIHPKNKQEVGRRLALWALALVYERDAPWMGPTLAGHTTENGAITLTFSHTDDGLVARGGELRGFQIAGSDRVWHPATAKIDGQKVVVSSPDVRQPVAVRYNWANNPDGNLTNGVGLPAPPFRTDDWPDTDPSDAQPTKR